MTSFLSRLRHLLLYGQCSHVIRSKATQSKDVSCTNAAQKVVPFYAIYGIADFGDMHSLILITQCKLVANIINAPIFQISQFEYVPLSNKKQSKSFKTSARMFDEMLNQSCFYFSPKYDLTHCLQMHIQTYGMDLSSIKIDIGKQSDNRFLVNKQFVQFFKENNMLHLIYPIIEGNINVLQLIRVLTQ
jgi:SacI homology domain